MNRVRFATLCVVLATGFASARADDAPKLQQPVDRQVFQRDENDRAVIPIKLIEGSTDTIVSVSLHHTEPDGTVGSELGEVKYSDGVLVGVPTGGPYTLLVQGSTASGLYPVASNLFVGDLWILAGQSNMEGVGDLIDVTPPHEKVMSLGMDGKWVRAEEPLHWLLDSPDPVHSGNPVDRADRAEAVHKTRTKGAGLGLPFAAAMVDATGVPIGLVTCAHGGTSMAQWDPAKKGEGGNSLYGSFLRQTALAGGKFKGLLWYQGESDAIGGAAEGYPKAFTDFIAAVRTDLNQPDLPFYLVQIGRFVNTLDPKGWNHVQDTQRLIPDQVSNTAVISVIDLELDDAIHVGTQGMKRAGKRMANVVLHELFGQPVGTTPTLDRVSRGPNNTLVVKFKGVNTSPSRSFGRGGMGGGMGGMGGGFRQFGAGASAGAGAVMMGGGFLMTPGLSPDRHIAGFSIRNAEGEEIPLIFEAGVGKARDTVILKLAGPPPAGSSLWYGWGLDPYCNLVDSADMAVPVFGPIGLDEVR